MPSNGPFKGTACLMRFFKGAIGSFPGRAGVYSHPEEAAANAFTINTSHTHTHSVNASALYNLVPSLWLPEQEQENGTVRPATSRDPKQKTD